MKSSIFKPVNAVTKSVPNSGKSSLMNMVPSAVNKNGNHNFLFNFLCLNLGPSAVKKNGNQNFRLHLVCPHLGPSAVTKNHTTNTNTTSLLIFNVVFSAFPGIRLEKAGSIENGDGRCVCVAWFGGWLKRFPFFLSADGPKLRHKTLKRKM